MEMNAFMFDAIGEVLMAAHHQLLLRCAGSAGVNLTDRMIERGLIPMYAEIDSVKALLIHNDSGDDEDENWGMFDDPPPPAPTDDDSKRSEYMTGMFRNVPCTDVLPLGKEYGYGGTVVVSVKAIQRSFQRWLSDASFLRNAVLQKLRVTNITSIKEYGEVLRCLRPLEMDSGEEVSNNMNRRVMNKVGRDNSISNTTNTNTTTTGSTALTTTPDNFMTYYKSFNKHLAWQLFAPLQHVTIIGDNFMSKMINVETIDLSPLCNVHTIGSGFLCVNQFMTLDVSMFTNVRRIGENFMETCNRLVTLDLRPLKDVEEIGPCFLGHSDMIRKRVDLSPVRHALSATEAA